MRHPGVGSILKCLSCSACTKETPSNDKKNKGSDLLCVPGDVKEGPFGGDRPVGAQFCRDDGGGWAECMFTDGNSDADTDG